MEEGPLWEDQGDALKRLMDLCVACVGTGLTYRLSLAPLLPHEGQEIAEILDEIQDLMWEYDAHVTYEQLE